MTLRGRVKRIGGSLGILIPRDFAEAMDVTDGTEVLTSPYGTRWTTTSVRRAFGAVRRRHSSTFEHLAT